MKRIILAIDALNPDAQAIDFACYIGRLTKSVITGIFLENPMADQGPVLQDQEGMPFLEWDVDEASAGYREKKALIEKNKDLFRDSCERKSVRALCQSRTGIPAAEIVEESRYADLVILDAGASFNRLYEGRPTEFVRDVLKEAECPVIIAPGSFEGVDEIVFTCDGSASAAFAVKQFALLFPELGGKKAVVLHVSKDGEWKGDDRHKFQQWMNIHYPLSSFQTLEGDAEDRLFDYLFKRKNVFIVMGAYGRSGLSRFFHHSQADLLINIMTQPIFISHQ